MVTPTVPQYGVHCCCVCGSGVGGGDAHGGWYVDVKQYHVEGVSVLGVRLLNVV